MVQNVRAHMSAHVLVIDSNRLWSYIMNVSNRSEYTSNKEIIMSPKYNDFVVDVLNSVDELSAGDKILEGLRDRVADALDEACGDDRFGKLLLTLTVRSVAMLLIVTCLSAEFGYELSGDDLGSISMEILIGMQDGESASSLDIIKAAKLKGSRGTPFDAGKKESSRDSCQGMWGDSLRSDILGDLEVELESARKTLRTPVPTTVYYSGGGGGGSSESWSAGEILVGVGLLAALGYGAYRALGSSDSDVSLSGISDR